MKIIASVLVLSTAVAAAANSLTEGRRESAYAVGDSSQILARQVAVCKPVPAPLTCEKSCGAGQITCVSLPSCYNPSWGESCCSDGTYCRSGYYCTDEGCCPVGKTLEQCGALKNTKLDDPDTSSKPASSSGTTISSALMTESSATASDSTVKLTKTKTTTATTDKTSSKLTTESTTETDMTLPTESTDSTISTNSTMSTDSPTSTIETTTGASNSTSTGRTSNTGSNIPTLSSGDDEIPTGAAARATAAALGGIVALAALFV